MVESDGAVPVRIGMALDTLVDVTRDRLSRNQAAHQLEEFLTEVCADLAAHRAYSVENRTELDALRRRLAAVQEVASGVPSAA
jgi:hypothetical protein